MITLDLRWSLPRGNTPVPSRWQATWRFLCSGIGFRRHPAELVVKQVLQM
jgi:hypothetical protein